MPSAFPPPFRAIAWALGSVAAAFLAGLVFSFAPAVWTAVSLELPPAYALKAQDPFSDTATLTIPEHPGERSHGAKLTPRLVGSALLWAATQAGAHPYWPATIAGLVLLLAGAVAGRAATGDPVVGLYTALAFAGLYAASASFALNWEPKPFDGVALGLVGVALVGVRWPVLLAPGAFVALWSDERAVLALGFIAVAVWLWPGLPAPQRRARWVLLGAAVAAYAVSRLIVHLALGWNAPDTSMVGVKPVEALSFLQLGAWLTLEGGWVVVGAATWLLWRRGARLQAGVLAAAGVAASLATVVVLDTSRAAAFAFPLLVAGLAALRAQGVRPDFVRGLAGAAAAVSLLAPNFEVIIGITVKWLPSHALILLNTP
jgi:hypothetical protein